MILSFSTGDLLTSILYNKQNLIRCGTYEHHTFQGMCDTLENKSFLFFLIFLLFHFLLPFHLLPTFFSHFFLSFYCEKLLRIIYLIFLLLLFYTVEQDVVYIKGYGMVYYMKKDNNNLLKILHPVLLNSLQRNIVSITPPSLGNDLKSLAMFMINAARHCIPCHWCSTNVPTLKEWFHKLKNGRNRGTD